MRFGYAYDSCAAATGSSACVFAPSYTDSLPAADAAKAASALFVPPVLLCALPVRRGGIAGKDTVD